MKTKNSKKQREMVISAPDLIKFGMGVMIRAIKVVNSAKKSKLTIRLEKE